MSDPNDEYLDRLSGGDPYASNAFRGIRREREDEDDEEEEIGDDPV